MCDSTMDDDQRERLLELLVDPSTTPEIALQYLSSPCTSLLTSINEDNINGNIVRFIACIRFVMTRLPDACVEGIWEDVLKRILKYSCNFCDIQHWDTWYPVLQEFANTTDYCSWPILDGNCIVHSPHFCNIPVPHEGPRVSTWLENALSTHNKCPNPYIRLELFRLVRLFSLELDTMSWERLCITLMHTICEIQPHHLYPSGNGDDVLFRASDLSCLVYACSRYGKLHDIISSGLFRPIDELSEYVDSNEMLEIKFLTQCLQLIGVFAVMTEPIYFDLLVSELSSCILVLKWCFYMLVHYMRKYLPDMFPWERFQYVFARQPFRHYAADALHGFTVVSNVENENLDIILFHIRSFANDLGVCSKNFDLPSLLLSRQVNGSACVCRHALLHINHNALLHVNHSDSDEEKIRDGRFLFTPIDDEEVDHWSTIHHI